MTLTFDHDLDRVKLKQQAKYLCQRLFSLNVIARTHRHTHIESTMHFLYLYHFGRKKNKKHLKNVGPIRHSEPPHAALPFTRCRYCRVARRLRLDVHDDDDDNDNA